MEVQAELAQGVSDARAILYCPSVTAEHAIVRVESCNGQWSFAWVRKLDSSDHRAIMSTGLAASLGIPLTPDGPRGLMTDSSTTLTIRDIVSDSNPTKSKISTDKGCSCSFGNARKIEVCFLERKDMSYAVLTSLEDFIHKILHPIMIWSGRQFLLKSFNRIDMVELTVLESETMGTGCCSSLFKVASSTNIHFALRFKDAPLPASPDTSVISIDQNLKDIKNVAGGVSDVAETVLRSMALKLQQSSKRSDRVQPSVGCLLTGLPGVGKTYLANAISQRIPFPSIVINAADIFQGFAGQSEMMLIDHFRRALAKSPSLLVIDGIEAIASSRRNISNSTGALEGSVLATLISCLDNLRSIDKKVFVLATTSDTSDLDTAIISNGRLETVVEMEPPAQAERLEILHVLTRACDFKESKEATLSTVSEQTRGFVGADLLSLVQTAIQAASSNATTSMSLECFTKALNITSPSILQAHHADKQSLRSSPTQDAFHHIFGLENAIQVLQTSLIGPLQDSSRYFKFGTKPPRGILLTGASGSGKTALATAIEQEVQMKSLASFVSVKCTDLITKVVGDTEKTLRHLFATAKNAAPCVLFFDQIESLAPVRGFDTSTEQTFDRLLSVLLVEMDGFASSSVPPNESMTMQEAFLQNHVVVLAATTKKELLDPAILRPGRFDVHIHVDLPDEKARCALVENIVEQIPVSFAPDCQHESMVLNDVHDLAQYAATRSDGWTALDIRHIFEEAAFASIRKAIDVKHVPVSDIVESFE